MADRGQTGLAGWEGEMFRLLVENVRDYAILVLDAEGLVRSWNPGAERLLGYAEGEVVGQSADRFYTPEDIRAGVPQQERRRALDTGRGEDDRWHVRKDGTRFWSGGVMTPLRDEAGALRGFAKIMRDRTDMMRAEEELARRAREAEQRRRLYEAALSNTPDLVYVFDLDHRFTYANEGLLAMWGRTWSEAIGKTCLELGYAPWHAAMHDREIEQVVATRQPVKGEVPFTGTFGPRVYEYIFVPVLGENGEVEAVAGTTRDVTDRRRAEEALRESEGRFRGLMEQAPFSIQVFSPDGHTLRVNRAWEELWGVTLGQIADYNVLHDPQLEDKGIAPYIRRAFAGEPVEIPAIQYDPNETIPDRTRHQDPLRWVSAVAYPLKDDAGAVREVILVHQDITARRRAEDALRDSERFHRAIAELSADYAFAGSIGPDGTVTIETATEGFDKFYGCNLAEMNERGGWGSVIHPDDHPAVGKTIQRLLAGETDTGEVRGLTKDGPVRWQSYLTVPVRDAGTGRVVGLYGAAKDVTAQRELTERLREQAGSLSAILSATVDHIYLLDRQGRYRYVSVGGARVLGLAPGDMTGKHWRELGLPAEVMEPFDAQRERAFSTGEPQRHEVHFRTEGGEARHYEYTIAPVRDVGGGFDAVVVVSRDDTERKRAEESVREAERRWRDLAEALPNLVWTDRPDGQCDYLSSQWGTYTGIPEQELLGLAWLERVIHPDDRERTLACWMTAVADRGVYDLEYRIRRHDGQYRWFKTRGVPIRDDQGRIVKWFGTCTDIEDEKRAAESLREADRRKDEFLATLAHELRNPLAPIRNSLQILKMPRLDAATAERSREMMERQVHHLVRLVDDLLDVSRVMRGKVELRKQGVELASVVARAVETAQPLIESQGHELTIRLPEESLPLEADPVRLAQVIGNLLTNAAKYTEANGRIVLTARREGGAVVLRVVDTGIGIPPDMLPKVFDLFVQVDHATTKAQGGLGIGLTLVKNLVELHAGSVEARSAGLGKGSEFVVRLPLSARSQEPPGEATNGEQPQQPSPSPGHRLLVVDDNRDAADSLALLLRLQGHEVRVAHDGPAALEVAQGYRPELVFLDIGMPGMDGYEVARRMRQQPGMEQVVLAALTGWGQQEDRRRTAEAGFNHHLVKPPEPQVLESVLAGLKSPRA